MILRNINTILKKIINNNAKTTPACRIIEGRKTAFNGFPVYDLRKNRLKTRNWPWIILRAGVEYKSPKRTMYVCMSVYVCMYLCGSRHIYMNTYLWFQDTLRTTVWLNPTQVYVCMYLCGFIWIWLKPTSMYVCVYICMYVCIYADSYVRWCD